MQGARQPIILIFSRPRQTLFFESIAEASRQTGISSWRILRGLQDPYGEIPNTRPAICVDEALEPLSDDDLPL